MGLEKSHFAGGLNSGKWWPFLAGGLRPKAALASQSARSAFMKPLVAVHLLSLVTASAVCAGAAPRDATQLDAPAEDGRTAAPASSTTAETDRAFNNQGIQLQASGPELSLRLGYAALAGRTDAAAPLRSRARAMLPLRLDLGYRWQRRWLFSAFGETGPGLLAATTSATCESCTLEWRRVGAQVQYRWWDTPTWNAWLGVGVGFQWFFTNRNDTADRKRTSRGFEIANLQVGTERSFFGGISLGPYWEAALGRFTTEQSTCVRCPRSEQDVTTETDGLSFRSTFGLKFSVLP